MSDIVFSNKGSEFELKRQALGVGTWLNQTTSLKLGLEVLLQKEFCYALFSFSYLNIGASIEILGFSGVCILKDFCLC